METRQKSAAHVIIYSILGLFAIVQVFPLFWSVLFSFKNSEDIVLKGTLSLPSVWMFSNYENAWIKGHIGEYFLNSVFVTFVTVVIVLLFGSMSAYAIARMKWALNKFTLMLILSGMMIPIQAILIPQFFVMKTLKLTKTYLSVILPYIGAGLPLAIFVLCGFMMTLPRETEEAAYIDGCGIFKMFFKIMLSLIKPALATVGVFTFISTWNEMIMATTYIYNEDLKTLPVGLMAFQGTHATDWGSMGAAMVIASIPAILFYFKFSNLVEKSITAGAILK